VLRLRSELVFRPASDDHGAALLDPLLGRTISLGATGVALAHALVELRQPAPLIAELVGAGFDRAKLEDTLRCFALLHLFDGLGDAVRARIAAIWAGEVELVDRALPGARFACQGSGMCCRSYRLGPVSDEDIAAVEALPVRTAFPQLPDGPLFVEREGAWFLRREANGCVFLEDGHRCGLHARFGEAAKPAMCRTYPIGMKLTFDAAVVYNNQHCSTHFVSQREGPPLIEAMRLVPVQRTGRITLFHPIVFVREDTPMDYAHFLELETGLRGVLASGDPFDQLVDALAVYDDFIAVARGFAIGTDPASALAAWRTSLAQRPPASARPIDGAAWDDALATFEELTAGLRRFLEDMAANPDERVLEPLTHELLPLLGWLADRARERPPRRPCSDDELHAALRTSLVQRLTAPLSLPDDRPLSALGEAALAIAVGFAGAALAGTPASLLAVSRGHATANRVLPTFTAPMFRRHPDRARALVTVLAALAPDDRAMASDRG
jgi:hypothetical protein